MQQGFTELAEQAIMLSQESAMRFGHNYIGAEHLLLGLVKTGKGLASKVLSTFGVTEDKIVKKIDELIGIMDSSTEQPLGFTPRTKRILELSFKECRRIGNNYIGTEHLLLGILKEGENIAVRIISDLGLNVQVILSELLRSIDMDKAFPSSSPNYKHPVSSTLTVEEPDLDLTETAKQKAFTPVIERENEIKKILQILCRKSANNPCLIGRPGVGKTTIVEGIAERISKGSVPKALKDKRVIIPNFLQAANQKDIYDRLLKAPNLILFIVDIHTLFDSNNLRVIKLLLAKGEIQIILAITSDEYEKYLANDSMLSKYFQPVEISEPSKEISVEILKLIMYKYEEFHNVSVTDEAIEAAVNLSDEYSCERSLPGKAMDIIDAAVYEKNKGVFEKLEKLSVLTEDIRKFRNKKEDSIREQNYENAAHYRDKEVSLKDELYKLNADLDKSRELSSVKITGKDIFMIINRQSSI